SEVAVALLKPLATVRLPPVIASRSSPATVMLLTVLVPDRWVTVCTPATLTSTSSAAPGSAGFELQLLTMSQKLVPAIQETVADSDGVAPRAATAAAIRPSFGRARSWRMSNLPCRGTTPVATEKVGGTLLPGRYRPQGDDELGAPGRRAAGRYGLPVAGVN